MQFLLQVGVSARHLHLCRKDMDILFGEGSELHVKKEISQPGQYAAQEQVTLYTPKTTMKLRVIGPIRKYTQIELSLTDARTVGIDAPIKNSGDLAETPGGASILGPKGRVVLERGIIVAARHVHLCEKTASKYGLVDGDIVDVKTLGKRSLTFHNVLVRAGKDHSDEFHIDTDEANACDIRSGEKIVVMVNDK